MREGLKPGQLSDPISTYSYMNHDSALARQMDMAQRELGAFLHVVSESFGSEEAAISADDWLDRVPILDCVLEPTPEDWRLVTIAAATQLAIRINEQGPKIYALPTSSNSPRGRSTIRPRRQNIKGSES